MCDKIRPDWHTFTCSSPAFGLVRLSVSRFSRVTVLLEVERYDGPARVQRATLLLQHSERVHLAAVRGGAPLLARTRPALQSQHTQAHLHKHCLRSPSPSETFVLSCQRGHVEVRPLLGPRRLLLTLHTETSYNVASLTLQTLHSRALFAVNSPARCAFEQLRTLAPSSFIGCTSTLPSPLCSSASRRIRSTAPTSPSIYQNRLLRTAHEAGRPVHLHLHLHWAATNTTGVCKQSSWRV